MKFPQELGFDNGKRSVILLTGYFILSIPINLIIQIIYKPPWPDWLVLLFYLCDYLIIALLIYEERAYLSYHHIDKWSLIIFLVFGSVLRSIRTPSLFVRSLGAIFFILIAVALFLKLRRENLHYSVSRRIGIWIFIGVLVGGGIYSIATILGVSDEINPEFTPRILISIVFSFVYYFGNTAISEEFIFRGFLWGILLRYGYKDRHILFITSILFTLVHIWGKNSTAFYISLFVFGSLYGILAWKSRSLVPCLVAHAVFNVTVDLIRINSM